MSTISPEESLISILDPNRSAPSGANILSRDPLVYTIDDFLSSEECEAFVQRAVDLEASGRPMKQSNPPQVSLSLGKLWPLPFLSLGAGIPPVLRYYEQTGSLPSDLSIVLPNIAIDLVATLVLAFGVVLPAIRKISQSKARTSLAMALNLEEDVHSVKSLVSRVSKAAQGHPWQAWEAPVFTRYTPGAIFAKHSDASPTRGSEWVDEGGQRVGTCICYMNDVKNGGETYFDQLGFAVTPKQGRALFFYPTVPGNSLDADDRLTHESLVAPGEEKCIIQMFARVGPRVPPPLGLPDSFEES